MKRIGIIGSYPSCLYHLCRGLIASFLLLPILGGCAPTELDWSEQVKLHDGRIIVVKRHEELGFSGFPLNKRGRRKFWEFCYAPMGIQWKSKPEYFPEVFDIVNGEAYVKVSLGGCETCMLQGNPETGALYFLWENNAWKKIAFKDFPSGLRYNMLNVTHLDDDGSGDARGLVTIAQKEERDSNIYYFMRINPEIMGLNETVSRSDLCRKCNYRIETNSTADVFLPLSSKDCK